MNEKGHVIPIEEAALKAGYVPIVAGEASGLNRKQRRTLWSTRRKEVRDSLARSRRRAAEKRAEVG